MMCYKNVVVMILTFNLMVNCAPRVPETIEWGTQNHFCGSAIPIIMGLICRVPERILPKQVEDTNHRVRRNIVDDCCKAACTLTYMQSYCHEDLEKTSRDKPIIMYT
ncbi:insulin-like growth factor II [Metopolophium dirhodum]|uniref:insulin-like growth factor II n=1 Tax=Metopolophium dirhodum TaxID=44670 RepID=UPI0029902C00|nr:insulin-like growth factor II [Metopolophium dirhodum]XP_060859193.1 insulin-like growth factor II [Metopolophium dirhodum]